MDWARDAAAKRQFENFAAGASETLLRTGYLVTGDAGEAEDLVQETFLRSPGVGARCGRWITRAPMPAGS
jgi:DNA-directed RNA polymerase specialized sigma24 family protein